MHLRITGITRMSAYGLEDPQSQHGHQGEVVPVGGLAGR
jgi:hypothetical protein